MTLLAILQDAGRREAFLTDGVRLVEEEVAGKSGLSGLAIKGGFKAMTAVRPGIVRDALAMLLPAFQPAIEPMFAEAQQSGDVAGWFTRHAARVADALLAVTDRKAETAQNPLLKRTYHGLRSVAKVHTEAAVPGVGRLLAKHST